MEVKLDYMIVCDNAYFSDDKKLFIEGVFEKIESPGFPAAHKKMSIVAQISNVSVGDHPIELMLENSSGQKSMMSNTLKKEALGGHKLIFNLFDTLFVDEGVYKFKLKIDGVILEGGTSLSLEKE